MQRDECAQLLILHQQFAVLCRCSLPELRSPRAVAGGFRKRLRILFFLRIRAHHRMVGVDSAHHPFSHYPFQLHLNAGFASARSYEFSAFNLAVQPSRPFFDPDWIH